MLLITLSKDAGILPSLAIPGYHLFSERNPRGYAYLTSEIFLITLYEVKTYESRDLFNYTRTFAFENAGVLLPTNYNSTWRTVESDLSYEDYIEYLYRQARQIYPDDPAKQDEYVELHKPQVYWKWRDTNSYLQFQKLLKRYRELGGQKTLILGLVVLNHVASGVDYLISKGLKKAGINAEVNSSLNFEEASVSVNFKF
jgi:hypothetical protein